MVNDNSDDMVDRITAEMADGALDAIQKLLDEGNVPRGTFPDDQVRNLVAMYNRRGDEIDALRRAIVGSAERFISPFPAPTAYQTEILACMIEEVAEIIEEALILIGSSVIKRATKTIRFGADEVQPGQESSNKERLSTEVGDLLAVLDFATAAGLIDPALVERQRAAKPKKLRKFLQNQPMVVSSGYRMFLDDERFPPDDGNEWVIARSFDEAMEIMEERGCPTFISFDHDLGAGRSGHDLAKWMIDNDHYDIMYIPEGFGFYVHSQNPIGAENIRVDMDNYLHYKKTKSR
jgi:hypothetical protein